MVHYSLDILKQVGLDSFMEKLPYFPIDKPGYFLDFVAQNSSKMAREVKQEILATLDLQKRLEIFLKLIKKSESEQQVKKNTDEQIEKKVKKELGNQQKIYYLKQKRKEIDNELRKLEGGTDNEEDEMQKNLQKLESEDYPQYVRDVVKKEIKKYEEIPPSSAEASVIMNYIE